MVDQFSIVTCYCKILSAISKTSPWFTLIFEVFCWKINSLIFLGVKGWRECEASEQVTLHVPVLRNYQFETSKTPVARFKIRGH